MIVRGKDGSLVQVNRTDFVNDDEYYMAVANGKGIAINDADRGKIQFDDVLCKISTKGGTVDDNVPRRKNSLGR